MMNFKNEPTYPVPMVPITDGFTEVQARGLMIRDYIAAQALAGMLANPEIVGLMGLGDQERYLLDSEDSRLALCHRAYILADDMAKAAEIPTA